MDCFTLETHPRGTRGVIFVHTLTASQIPKQVKEVNRKRRLDKIELRLLEETDPDIRRELFDELRSISNGSNH